MDKQNNYLCMYFEGSASCVQIAEAFKAVQQLAQQLNMSAIALPLPCILKQLSQDELIQYDEIIRSIIRENGSTVAILDRIEDVTEPLVKAIQDLDKYKE